MLFNFDVASAISGIKELEAPFGYVQRANDRCNPTGWSHFYSFRCIVNRLYSQLQLASHA